MKVIISGGSGLVGSALARDLAEDGHEVFILSRSPEQNRGRYGEGIQVVGWDGLSSKGWGYLVEEADAIVNLTGENLASGRWTEARKRKIIQSRVEPGQAIVEAVRQAKIKPKLLIQSSAIGYYGARGDETITEEAGPGDEFQTQVCITWEDSTAAVEELGVRRVITRSGIILDALEGALPRMILPFMFYVGGPIGSGKQWISYISLFDEVKAIRFLLENEAASGVYNLTTPNPLRNKDFEKAIGQAVNRPSIIPVPAFAMKLLFGEMSIVLLTGQRVLPERLLAAGFKFDHPDAKSALRAVLKGRFLGSPRISLIGSLMKFESLRKIWK
jgi:uncharacterized protein